MNATLSLESILQMLQPLSADNKRWLGEKLIEESRRWLGEKLIEESREEEEEHLTPYTMEEINAWIDDFEAELEAGEPGYTLEEFDTQMRKEHGWL